MNPVCLFIDLRTTSCKRLACFIYHEISKIFSEVSLGQSVKQHQQDWWPCVSVIQYLNHVCLLKSRVVSEPSCSLLGQLKKLNSTPAMTDQLWNPEQGSGTAAEELLTTSPVRKRMHVLFYMSTQVSFSLLKCMKGRCFKNSDQSSFWKEQHSSQVVQDPRGLEPPTKCADKWKDMDGWIDG